MVRWITHRYVHSAENVELTLTICYTRVRYDNREYTYTHSFIWYVSVRCPYWYMVGTVLMIDVILMFVAIGVLAISPWYWNKYCE